MWDSSDTVPFIGAQYAPKKPLRLCGEEFSRLQEFAGEACVSAGTGVTSMYLRLFAFLCAPESICVHLWTELKRQVNEYPQVFHTLKGPLLAMNG